MVYIKQSTNWAVEFEFWKPKSINFFISNGAIYIIHSFKPPAKPKNNVLLILVMLNTKLMPQLANNKYTHYHCSIVFSVFDVLNTINLSDYLVFKIVIHFVNKFDDR